MLFVGDDWAEAHHDIEIEDEAGHGCWSGGGCRRGWPGSPRCTSWSLTTRSGRRAGPGAGGDRDRPRPVGAGADRGRLHGVCDQPVAGGPLPGTALARRGRSPIRAMRTCWPRSSALDRAHHRPVAGDTAIAEHVKVAARAHQTMIWTRQRQVEHAAVAAAGVLPGRAGRVRRRPGRPGRAGRAGRRAEPRAGPPAVTSARIETLLRKAGRQRNLDRGRGEIEAALRTEQLTARPGVVARLCRQRVGAGRGDRPRWSPRPRCSAGQVEQGFGRHPDVEIYLSQPGLGPILGARVLAEFGDDPDRYADARARKNYSGMAPITRASGTKRVVLARYARNRRLGRRALPAGLLPP